MSKHHSYGTSVTANVTPYRLAC